VCRCNTGKSHSSKPRRNNTQLSCFENDTMTVFQLVHLLFYVILSCSFVTTTSNVVPVRLHGLNYNTRQGPDWMPYDLRCKTKQQIWTDLSLLQKLTNRIRLLSITDCNQTELVLDVAKEIGMQVWLGLWVDDDESIYLEEISAFEDIISRGLIDTSTVLGVTVGSEVLLRNDATLDQLLEYVTQVRIALAASGGSNLPVSITEISYYYRRNQLLREHVDALYMNIFPYFNWKENGNINGAVDKLIGDASSVLSLSSGGIPKRLILGETGWPSDGGNLASPEHQLQYFVDFFCQVHVARGWDYYYFTGIDNAWRQDQNFETVEGNWGFFKEDLALKSHFEDLVFDCGGDTQYSFAETDWSVPIPPESCQAHDACAGIGGNCCPTDDGIW
jgi:glucan 1,3-beta-glucosidase